MDTQQIKKPKNWTLSILGLGILFFCILGWTISNAKFPLTNTIKFLILYWTLGLFFGLSICLYVYDSKVDAWKSLTKSVVTDIIFFPTSLLLTAILVEQNFFPKIVFFCCLTSWIIWGNCKRNQIDIKLSLLDVLTISWVILGFFVTLGQFPLTYSRKIITEIHSVSIFLDLRLSLLILILVVIITQALSKINFEDIKGKELLKTSDKENSILHLFLTQLYILINFLFEIGWKLIQFFKLWGIECRKSAKERYNKSVNTILHSLIMIFSIIGFYILTILSKKILLYVSLKAIPAEALPLFYIILLVLVILIFSFFINQFQSFLLTNNRLTIIDKDKFANNKRKLFELYSFPIQTAGIASAILFGLSKIPYLQLFNFTTIGLYPIILLAFLVISIVLDRFSNSNNLVSADNSDNGTKENNNSTAPQKIDLTNKEGAKKNWRDRKFLKFFDWNKKDDTDDE